MPPHMEEILYIYLYLYICISLYRNIMFTARVIMHLRMEEIPYNVYVFSFMNMNMYIDMCMQLYIYL
jgi:hypothetical protein